MFPPPSRCVMKNYSISSLSLFAFAFLVPLASAQGTPVSAVPATIIEFNDEYESYGSVLSSERVDLKSERPGRIEAIIFEDGAFVEKGQILLVLDDKENAALISGAQARKNEAKQRFERLKNLTQSGTVSKEQFERAERDFISAESDLASIQARTNNSVVRAPFSGIMGLQELHVGAFITTEDVFGTLERSDEVFVEFYLPFHFSRSILEGFKVSIEPDYDGIAPIVTTSLELDNHVDKTTRNVRARSRFSNAELGLIPGSFAAVVVSNRPSSSIAVPERSVRIVGKDTFVFVEAITPEGSKASMKKVAIGRTQNGWTEITSGLAESEMVIVDGMFKMRDGRPITVASITRNFDPDE